MKTLRIKSGLTLGIASISLIVLLDAGSSYAQSSFKNTPLYRHVVKRASSQPVTLYDKKPAAPAEQDVVAKTSSTPQVVVAEKGTPSTSANPAGPARPGRVPMAPVGPIRLADPSTFTPEMPLREAVEILRNSTFPRLNIAVLWKDLEENADIYPDTPIGIDGVSGVKLGRHLKSLVEGVSGGAVEKVGFAVEDGVIVIATVPNLPQRMVTRTYDVTDLVGQPSTGFPPFGMGMMGMGMPGMMGGMGGMMGGMGGMGGMMPGMGGMMGGMMPGMGGMMGGMMPGMGGGYGFSNFGGGYGGLGTGLSTGIGTSLGFGGIRY